MPKKSRLGEVVNATILKIFSPKKIAKKWRFLTQNKAKLCKILIITLVFKKNAIFCRKLAKIAENCDYNIDPLRADARGSNPPGLKDVRSRQNEM
jgi:hypothetical protein